METRPRTEQFKSHIILQNFCQKLHDLVKNTVNGSELVFVHVTAENNDWHGNKPRLNLLSATEEINHGETNEPIKVSIKYKHTVVTRGFRGHMGCTSPSPIFFQFHAVFGEY